MRSKKRRKKKWKEVCKLLKQTARRHTLNRKVFKRYEEKVFLFILSKKKFFGGTHNSHFYNSKEPKALISNILLLSWIFSLSPVEWHFLTSAVALNRLENWIERDNSLQRRPCRLVFREMGNVYENTSFQLSWKFANNYTHNWMGRKRECVSSRDRRGEIIYTNVFLYLDSNSSNKIDWKNTSRCAAWLLLLLYICLPKAFQRKTFQQSYSTPIGAWEKR